MSSNHNEAVQASIGKLLKPGEGKRDAIHVAICPMEAKEVLTPGQDVDEHGKSGVRNVGKVDPFLPQGTKIQPGQWFWCFLYPNTVTGLRHQWTHPAFPEEDAFDLVRQLKSFVELKEKLEKKEKELAERELEEQRDYGTGCAC